MRLHRGRLGREHQNRERRTFQFGEVSRWSLHSERIGASTRLQSEVFSKFARKAGRPASTPARRRRESVRGVTASQLLSCLCAWLIRLPCSYSIQHRRRLDNGSTVGSTAVTCPKFSGPRGSLA